MNDLTQEAHAIVKQLSLLEILGSHSDAKLVGSVPLDLVVKLDIDFHVLVNKSNLLFIVDGIYHQLLEEDLINEVRITDYRPEGVKLGIDRYPSTSGDWSIDIWVTNQIETTAFSFIERLKKELLPKHRSAIMTIKRYYHHQGLLRDGISKLIYQAVLDDGIRTVEEFLRFLEDVDDLA